MFLGYSHGFPFHRAGLYLTRSLEIASFLTRTPVQSLKAWLMLAITHLATALRIALYTLRVVTGEQSLPVVLTLGFPRKWYRSARRWDSRCEVCEAMVFYTITRA